jgi:hypothetical protein
MAVFWPEVTLAVCGMDTWCNLRSSILRGCCVAFLFLTAQLVNGEEKAQPSKWSPESLLVSESLSKNSNVPIVSVRVGDKDYRFLVHTSEVVTMLDRSLCVGLKPFRLEGRELPIELKDMLHPPPMQLGRLKLRWVPFVDPIDCSDLSKETGEPIHGILGMDVLMQLVLQIDPDNDLLQIAMPSVTEPPPGFHFPLDFGDDFVPKVVCTIAPAQFTSFAIDTASLDNGSVDEASAKYVLKNGGQLGLQRAISTPDGVVKKLDAVTVPGVAFGNVALRNLLFSVEETNHLGFDSLLRCRIAFDFKNKRIYCLPSKLITSRDRNSHFGMVLDVQHPHFVVKRVGKGMAADAGIVAGDRIASINGYSVESQLVRAYRALCAPSPAPTVLDVERRGRRVTVTIPGEP